MPPPNTSPRSLSSVALRRSLVSHSAALCRTLPHSAAHTLSHFAATPRSCILSKLMLHLNMCPAFHRGCVLPCLSLCTALRISLTHSAALCPQPTVVASQYAPCGTQLRSVAICFFGYATASTDSAVPGCALPSLAVPCRWAELRQLPLHCDHCIAEQHALMWDMSLSDSQCGDMLLHFLGC